MPLGFCVITYNILFVPAPEFWDGQMRHIERPLFVVPGGGPVPTGVSGGPVHSRARPLGVGAPSVRDSRFIPIMHCSVMRADCRPSTEWVVTVMMQFGNLPSSFLSSFSLFILFSFLSWFSPAPSHPIPNLLIGVHLRFDGPVEWMERVPPDGVNG